MVVTVEDVLEYPVNVLIHSKAELTYKNAPISNDTTDTSLTSTSVSLTTESPVSLEISEKAEALEIGRLTKVEFFNDKHFNACIISSSESWGEIPYLS